MAFEQQEDKEQNVCWIQNYWSTH